MNVFVTYAVGAGLSILVIATLILSLGSLSSQWSGFLSEYEPRQVCTSLQNAISIMHNPSNGSGIMARMNIDLPDKIGGNDYFIEFKESTIFIKSEKEYSCNVTGVMLSGASGANRIQLEYSTPNNIVIK